MRFIFICSLYFISPILYAQREATHWFFGSQAGLYFNSNGPSPIYGSAMHTQDGCATMSDKQTGELLFYTNGRNVWNRNNLLMPNGQDFPDSCWSGITQSALIVPFPNDESKYYLFSIYYTTTLDGSIFIEPNCNYGEYTTAMFRQVRYSVIDMTLDDGNGDVVVNQKQILLQTNATEKITVVPHANGSDYWIVTHAFNSNEFYVYQLTHSGIAEPNIIAIGSVHETRPDRINPDEETRGYMKASPNGKKLACAVYSDKHSFDLFDFDATSGQISNYVNLGLLPAQYGISFSPDNSKLYVNEDDIHEPSVYPYPDVIAQYNLAAGDSQAIVASRKSIFRDNPYTNIPGHGLFEGFGSYMGLQLAMDGKIYATANNAYSTTPEVGNIMAIIEKPNEEGVNCQVNYKQFDFGNAAVGSGLPNFIESYFNNIESSTTCSEETSISFFPNPTSNTVHINFLSGCDSHITITVFNVLGQQVATFESTEQETEIDISAWSSGVYFFVCSTLYNHRIVKKIIKT